MDSKQKVLMLLEQTDAYLSGEKMAEALHISRNSVWKAINGLRREGYRIEAVTNRGYRLVQSGDQLSKNSILRNLNCGIDADRIRIEPSLESTSKTVKELALAGAPHKTVILADRQTNGNAHHANSFFSPPGGFYMSILLRTGSIMKLSPGALTEFSALCTAEAVEHVSGIRIEIRGINDLFLNGKKIGGILNESMSDFESGEHQWIVIGIGMYVGVPEQAFPDRLKNSTGSLFGETVPGDFRNRLAAEILNRLLGDEKQDEEQIHSRYREYRRQEH